jgi:PucR C-terminal helix-turn-helix domain/GGDEF-like domain
VNRRSSEPQRRSELRSRLQARREEIESAVRARVRAISEPDTHTDFAYAQGLRNAVSAALDYGIAAIEASSPHEPPVPVELLSQARLAARNGIHIGTVLRRYFAGYSLLGYFIVEEAAKDGLIGGAELQRLSGAQAGLFDRLLAAVAEEHRRERQGARAETGEHRRLECVRRLLDGEAVDTAEVAYEFDGWHVGVAVAGRLDPSVVRTIADTLGRRLLLVRPDEQCVWAWLGGREPLDPTRARVQLAVACGSGCAVAIGEPAEGHGGWRLTHRQAIAALPVAMRGPDRVVRYRDVALLASALQDDLLSTSLRRLYLDPLEDERDGAVARETLRAYLDAGGNVSSTAAGLGVKRHTVTRRLRAIEASIGLPVARHIAEFEMALRLAERDERILANHG